MPWRVKVGCPVISRDEIKEGLVNTLENGGTLDLEPKWHVHEVFFGTIEHLLKNNITLVAEAAFQHKLWAPKLYSLKDSARIRLVNCSIDPQLARSRFIKRGLSDSNRTRFHGDKAVHSAKQFSCRQPERLQYRISDYSRSLLLPQAGSRDD